MTVSLAVFPLPRPLSLGVFFKEGADEGLRVLLQLPGLRPLVLFGKVGIVVDGIVG